MMDIWSRLPSIEAVEPYATTLAAFAIIGIAVQILLQRRSVNADEARLARESAVFLYSVFGDEAFREERRVIGLKSEQATENMSDETRAAFKAVLHRYGLVSLAHVHGGVKAEMINSYWGNVLLKDWERLEPFVKAEREKYPFLHKNTEVMVEHIRGMDRA
ncbi:hypothetical protein V8J82_18535 [Gymnodinialimonas sp. 2305UL16-5]|uniref:DUF4760 domain-containing protein n=1 Tax=Gymnodinialimonas mytili TaxID=3126503 RepID=UPI00309D6359